MNKKIIIMGNGAYGAFFADEVLKLFKEYEITWFVTTVDKYVKKAQKSHNIQAKVVTSKLEVEREIQKVMPLIALCASFGVIVNIKSLKFPVLGCFNFHPSVLPLYRGASPIRSAMLNNDEGSGVTVYQMNQRMDAGDILLQDVFSIEKMTYDDVIQIVEMCTAMQIKKMYAFLNSWDSTKTELKLLKQEEKLATYCKKITDEDGYLDLLETTEEVIKKIRALGRVPGTPLMFMDKRVFLRRAEKGQTNLKPWQVLIDKKAVEIGTSNGSLKVIRLQKEGSVEMGAPAFVNGWKEKISFQAKRVVKG